MPKITKIEEQKRNKDRVNIYVDGKYERSASKYSIKINGIKEDMEINLEKLEKVIHTDDVEKAKGYVVDYHLNKSYELIKRKLKQKEYNDKVIEEVMDFLKQYELVDDKVYAESKAKDLQNLNKKSKRMIEMELKRSGIDQETINEALENIDEDKEYENAKKIVEKKINDYKRKSANIYEFKNRIYRLLASKAYDSDMITKIMNEYEREWD